MCPHGADILCEGYENMQMGMNSNDSPKTVLHEENESPKPRHFCPQSLCLERAYSSLPKGGEERGDIPSATVASPPSPHERSDLPECMEPDLDTLEPRQWLFTLVSCWSGWCQLIDQIFYSLLILPYSNSIPFLLLIHQFT